jgi:hypothetical protein
MKLLITVLGFVLGAIALTSDPGFGQGKSVAGVGQMTYVSLPMAIDPTHQTYPVRHGTKVYAVPRFAVAYRNPENASEEIVGEVWGMNLRQTVENGQMIVTNDTGYSWHFPVAVQLRPTNPALAFVAPGTTGPRVIRNLTPALVVP